MTLGARELVAELERDGKIKRLRPQLTFWLRLFVFQQLFTLGYEVLTLVGVVRVLVEQRGLPSVFVRIAVPYELARLGLHSVFLFVIATGLVLLLRRVRATPRYWVVTLTFLIPWRLFDQMLQRLQRSSLERAGFVFQTQRLELSLTGYILGCALVVAWWVYWVRSPSVRILFGVRGLDDLSAAPTGGSGR